MRDSSDADLHTSVPVPHEAPVVVGRAAQRPLGDWQGAKRSLKVGGQWVPPTVVAQEASVNG